MRTLLGLLVLAATAAGCGDDDGTATPTDAGTDTDSAMPDAGVDAGPWMPDNHCPGGDGCPDEGDGVLHVGAAAVDVTPEITDTTDIQTVDVNGDGEYSYEDGDEF